MFNVQATALAPARAEISGGSHFVQVSDSVFAAAPTPIVATLAVTPTLALSNALPLPAEVTLFEAWPVAPDAPWQEAAPAPEDGAEETGEPKQRGKQEAGADRGPLSVTADCWTPGLPADDVARAALLHPNSPLMSHVRTRGFVSSFTSVSFW